MATDNSVLLLLGDAEASLLADAEIALQTMFPDAPVGVARGWMTRPDWLGTDDARPPASLVERGLLPADNAAALLAGQYRLVVLPLFPAVGLPAMRHRDGGAFLVPRTLRASWNEQAEEIVARECTQLPALTPDAAAASLEPELVRLQEAGVTVALVTTFRHVPEPLAWNHSAGPATLRELVRRTNLETYRLSQRTGCFVLDLDRPLAQEGGAQLQADCFGGSGRAAEIAVDEFAALALDALPDGLAIVEA